MTKKLVDQLVATYAAAKAEATAELTDRGFVKGDDEVWGGKMPCGRRAPVNVRLNLPTDFPDALPSVFVDRSAFPRRVPHVEKSGKVCVAPATGVLLDTTRPRAIVAETLASAAQTVEAGLSGKNEEDLLDEFLAYWDHGLGTGICSICDADGKTRPLHRVEIEGWRTARGSRVLVSDAANVTEEWCRRLGRPSVPLQDAFLVRLQGGFPPPDFDMSLTIGEVCDLIRRTASDETRGALKGWLDRVRLPATVLMTMPLPQDSARVLIAVELPAPVGRAGQAAKRGFRLGREPTRRQLGVNLHTPVQRMFVERLDPGFLLPRAGTVAEFAARTVAVVGCGAVGSRLVERLASLGIGRLRLVDHEKLIPANIHRHALGMEALGCNKAAALCVMVGRRFPHMKVDYRETRVQDLLATDEDFLITADVVVIALPGVAAEQANAGYCASCTHLGRTAWGRAACSLYRHHTRIPRMPRVPLRA